MRFSLLLLLCLVSSEGAAPQDFFIPAHRLAGFGVDRDVIHIARDGGDQADERGEIGVVDDDASQRARRWHYGSGDSRLRLRKG